MRRFADEFSEDGLARLLSTSYYDARSLALDGPAAVLHSKAVAADGETVFVTSTNLTEPARDESIELGVVAQDDALATSVTAHFQCLNGEILTVAKWMTTGGTGLSAIRASQFTNAARTDHC